MAQQEEELLRRRRDHLILRVDRADLSKNVLRGFSSFDLFLEQHPEFRERVTFIAQLMPSRTDVPEYAEYLERIEALVAVVNHRHGTPDWMPIQLKLRDDLEEAVAAYKHYDVLLVNAMFDGMNLVAKEGPMVNERDGVSILSENTGAHEELGEHALSVNPFDIQALADSIHAALTMEPAERGAPPARAQGDRHGPRSGRLDRRAARRHPREGGADGGGALVGRPVTGAPNSVERAGSGSRVGRLARGVRAGGRAAVARLGAWRAGRPWAAASPSAGGRQRVRCARRRAPLAAGAPRRLRRRRRWPRFARARALRALRSAARRSSPPSPPARRSARASLHAPLAAPAPPAPPARAAARSRDPAAGRGRAQAPARRGGGSRGARPPRRGHATTTSASATSAASRATLSQRILRHTPSGPIARC